MDVTAVEDEVMRSVLERLLLTPEGHDAVDALHLGGDRELDADEAVVV